MPNRFYFYNDNYYLLIEGLLAKAAHGGIYRDAVAMAMRGARKKKDVPLLLGLTFWPGPGTTAVGTTLLAVPPRDRAKLYRSLADDPVETMKKVPGVIGRRTSKWLKDKKDKLAARFS